MQPPERGQHAGGVDIGTIPEGFCQCGCGEETTISPHNNARYGHITGVPRRFVHGHHRRKPFGDGPGPNPDGLCVCGCGGSAPISKQTDTRKGYVKGRPLRYIAGHQPKDGNKTEGPDYVAEDRGHDTPCWVWQRSKYTTGYGYMTKKQAGGEKRKLAHRVYYEKAKGPIPDGLELDHLCAPSGGPKSCVNPAHLEPVTHAENMRRSGVSRR